MKAAEAATERRCAIDADSEANGHRRSCQQHTAQLSPVRKPPGHQHSPRLLLGGCVGNDWRERDLLRPRRQLRRKHGLGDAGREVPIAEDRAELRLGGLCLVGDHQFAGSVVAPHRSRSASRCPVPRRQGCGSFCHSPHSGPDRPRIVTSHARFGTGRDRGNPPAAGQSLSAGTSLSSMLSISGGAASAA